MLKKKKIFKVICFVLCCQPSALKSDFISILESYLFKKMESVSKSWAVNELLPKTLMLEFLAGTSGYEKAACAENSPSHWTVLAHVFRPLAHKALWGDLGQAEDRS